VGPDVRSRLRDELHRRVYGRRSNERRREIFESDEPGWFDDDAAIRVVHGDVSMFIGGLRALLMQTLHPLAMAGVAQHSSYRTDPWGRLERTAHFVTATSFGPASMAENAVATVHRVHERVQGTASDGRPYSANDPHLLLWVHLAEIDSFFAAHDRYGSRPLTGADRDRYVADTAVVADRLGVINPPESERAMRERMRAFRPELRATPEAREAVRYLLVRPPVSGPLRPVYGVIAAAAVELMPLWTRRPLRLPFLPIVESFAVRPVGEALTRTLRWASTA
jgi:uncharacterized protein (DUF2236 family)